MTTLSPTSESAILSRAIAPERADFRPEVAEAILGVSFTEQDRKRMRELAQKARQGHLSVEEQEEANNYERVGHFLSILQAKAQFSLQKTMAASGDSRMKQSLRDVVWERAEGICEYCQLPQQYDHLSFEVDHVIAEKHHGPTTEANCALSCFACNNHKGACIAGFDLTTQRIVRLFHPRKDRWNKHFEWDGPELVGRTAIGRVTTDVLAINLSYRQELRKVLIGLGVFPPQRRGRKPR